MGDVHCAVCREPWDAYGVRHGDMMKWEADLFRRGAGCPACEGVTPRGVDPDEARLGMARDLVLDVADDDPHAFAVVNELGSPPSPRPPWLKPEPPTPVVHYECAGCGVECRTEVDVDTAQAELCWHAPPKARCSHLHTDHPCYWDPPESPEPECSVGGLAACPHCAAHCHDCGEPLIEGLEGGDTYDPGVCFHAEGDYYGRKPLCIDCYEKIPRCSYCCAELCDDDPTDDEGRGPCCGEFPVEGEDDDEPCQHPDQYVNDRAQWVCCACGEELGR